MFKNSGKSNRNVSCTSISAECYNTEKIYKNVFKITIPLTSYNSCEFILT